MTLGDHLRSDQHGRPSIREALERFSQAPGSQRCRRRGGSARARTCAAELGSSRCVPAPMRASSTEPHRDTRREARREAAVMAMEPRVRWSVRAMSQLRTATRRAAGAAVDRAARSRAGSAAGSPCRRAPRRRRAPREAAPRADTRLAPEVDELTDGSGAPMRVRSSSRSRRLQLSTRGVALP
jgi:hypothetical protein